MNMCMFCFRRRLMGQRLFPSSILIPLRPIVIPPGEKERGGLETDHPESVTITFSLALQKVEQANAAASQLLQVCAFLAPDAIPEELLTAGKDALGPVLEPVVTDPFRLNASLRTLLAYSLIQREARSQLLYVHRLVQAVLMDMLSAQEQQSWAERVIRAVSAAFPDVRAKDGW